MFLIDLEEHLFSQLASGGFLSACDCQSSASLHADRMFPAPERYHCHMMQECAAGDLEKWMSRPLVSEEVLWLDFQSVHALRPVPSVADLPTFHLYLHPRGTI